MGFVPPPDEASRTRRETITLRALIIAVAALWLAGLILNANQRMHPTMSNQAQILAAFWDLTFASLGLGLAPHYRSPDSRTALIWSAVSKLPAADRAEIAAVSHRTPLAAQPWAWRTCSYFATVAWALSIAYTIQVATGAVHPSLIRLVLTMVFLLAAAVQGSISTIVGLDRARHERTYDIALQGPAASNPIVSPAFNKIASAAIDECRDGTGEIPRYDGQMASVSHLRPAPERRRESDVS